MNRPSTSQQTLASNREKRSTESAALRANREARESQGKAKSLPGIPDKPVMMPGKMWSDRQRESVGEFLEFLPIIEIVAALPPVPTVVERTQMNEAAVEQLMDARLSALMAAKKIVVERLRKET